MKIAISGKGGSGKTTIAGTLARFFAGVGYPVLAIDGDSNPCLDLALGIAPESFPKALGVPHDLAQEVIDADGRTRCVLPASLDELCIQYGAEAPAGIRLLRLRPIDHAGDG